MGTGPRRGPQPLDPRDATRDLARHLLRLLGHAELTPYRLVTYGYVPYNLTTLNTFLYGESLPPPHLIDVVASLCGGDQQELRQAYDRALRATLAANDRSAAEPPPRALPPAPQQQALPPAPQNPLPAPVDLTNPVNPDVYTSMDGASDPTRSIPPGSIPSGAIPPGAVPPGILPTGPPPTLPPPALAGPPPQAPPPAMAGPPPLAAPTYMNTPGELPVTTRTREPTGRARSRRRRGSRSRMITAALGISAVGAVVVVTAGTVVGLGNERRNAGDRDRADAAPGQAPAPASDVRDLGGSASARPLSGGQQTPTSVGSELVQNGDFTQTAWEWRGSDKVKLEISDQRLRVDVESDSGADPMDEMVMQDLPGIRFGKKYAVKFDASAEKKTSIAISVQRQMVEDAPQWFSREVDLTTEMQTFSYTFSAKLDTNLPIICFQVGGHPDGHTMWLDNVSLVELP